MAAAPTHGTRIPADLQAQIDETIKRAIDENWAERIWGGDTSVWTDDEKVAALISNRLGWLDLPTKFADEVDTLEAFAGEIRAEGLIRAVVAGMLPAIARSPRLLPNQRQRPSSRSSSKCRTGAGPTCRSICAPASEWRGARRRLPSNSRSRH